MKILLFEISYLMLGLAVLIWDWDDLFTSEFMEYPLSRQIISIFVRLILWPIFFIDTLLKDNNNASGS